ncbi:MAG: carboxypeptidase-like regulatory domain-containing protein [Bacteroidota bacterium]
MFIRNLATAMTSQSLRIHLLWSLIALSIAGYAQDEEFEEIRFGDDEFATREIAKPAEEEVIKKISVRGKVVDKDSQESLPFAHVQIGEIRTVTNLDGDFNILIKSNEASEIHVSFIGYIAYKAPLDPNETELRIELSPTVTELEAVVVKTGRSIVEDVIRNLPTNYILENQFMTCYYKESIKQQEKFSYLAEGILDVFQPSEVSNEKTLISPVRTRKQESEAAKDNMVLVYGHASDMLQSLVRREKSFISSDMLDHYEYEYMGASTYDGRNVFIVDFEPKTRKGSSRGKMYIDETSYAIIKAEYSPLLRTNTLWDEVHWVEEFDADIDGIWDLNRVTYAGTWYQDDLLYTYNSLLVVNESEIVTEVPHFDIVLGDRDVFYDAAGDFSDEFWTGHNYIKLNKSELSSM